MVKVNAFGIADFEMYASQLVVSGYLPGLIFTNKW